MAPEAAPTRRFRPEPVETTVRSNRRSAQDTSKEELQPKEPSNSKEEATKPRRTVALEPIETATKTRRRFVPEPFEFTVKSSRDRQKSRSQDFAGHEHGQSEGTDSITSVSNKPRRKFAPQLIETAKRSRRTGDSGPAILPSDKTEAVPIPRSQIGKGLAPEPPVNTPTGGHSNLSEILEARRLGKALPVRTCSRTSHRSHSFRVPDLEPIESSQSEGSSPPSLSTSPSTSSDKSYLYKHATRIRESVDDRYSGYLLDVAAKAAEKQLREQAMAAFPNDDHHEPVDHYVDDAADHTPGREGARSSFSQINWDLREMQQFQRRLSQQKARDQEGLQTAMKKAEAKAKAKEPATAWVKPAATILSKEREISTSSRPPKETRPPMLGADIAFPRCASPDSARFDVTQSCQTLKESVCYLTEQCEDMNQVKDRLWAAKKQVTTVEEPKKACDSDSPRENTKPNCLELPILNTPPNSAGLWGGCCVAKPRSRAPSGILTPRVGISTPIATPCPTPSRDLFHSEPTDYFSGVFSGISEKLEAEAKVEEEFSDAFVTQVYNYLSLGYPSIARDFDAELSKISRIDVSILRQDDYLTDGKGYIRLGEDEQPSTGIAEESCNRWRALRTYTREWARQQPGMVSGAHALGGFGVAARRGSWAI